MSEKTVVFEVREALKISTWYLVKIANLNIEHADNVGRRIVAVDPLYLSVSSARATLLQEFGPRIYFKFLDVEW